jgi:hypothetical protein
VASRRRRVHTALVLALERLADYVSHLDDGDERLVAIAEALMPLTARLTRWSRRCIRTSSATTG